MSTDPDYDDDGSPKFETEQDRREAWAKANRLVAICPECRDAKHGNCNGDAWSDYLDRVVPCTCTHVDLRTMDNDQLTRFVEGLR